MINAEVQRHGNENVAGLMRRFTRKLQSAGVVKRVRSLRYYTRLKSNAQAKKNALTRIERRAERTELIKMGREVEKKPRRR